MNRHYIREAAVIGVYDFFLKTEANIENFQQNTHEQSPITKEILNKHNKNLNIDHYEKFFSETEQANITNEKSEEENVDEELLEKKSDKEFLQEFITEYNDNFKELENNLIEKSKQIKIDTVIFMQLLYKLKTLFDLDINVEINDWLNCISENFIVALRSEYVDFWAEKNKDINNIKTEILRNVEDIHSIKDFVMKIFFSPILYEFLAEEDIEWDNNFEIIKKKILNGNFPNLLDENEKFEEKNKFYLDLVHATIDNLEVINTKISSISLNWDIERISLLDKSILSLAIGEFFFVNHLPKQIIINEYLEISKKISRIDSSIFINGILDKLLI